MFHSNLPLSLNEEFRRNLIDNFNFLNKRNTSLLRNLNAHKQDDQNAHATDQIVQGGRNQKNINNDLQSQIDHLAVAPRNNSENEIVQARVDILGNKYPSLKRHLIAWEERTKVIKEEILEYVDEARKEIKDVEYRFEPDEQEYQFVTNLSPKTNAVMQHFWIDNRTGLIYMLQARSEGYRLNRLKPNGEYIDSSMVIGGGHGTHNAFRYINDELWIYSYIKDANNNSRVVRFKYKPNINYTYGTYGMVDVFDDGREILPVINEKTNEILFRIEYPKSEWNKRNAKFGIEIRDLDDVDKIKSKFEVPLSLATDANIMQGVDLDEDYVYWWTGTSDISEDNLLTIFNKNNGKEIERIVIDITDKEGDFAEPEGMQLYYDKDTGKKALLLGITTGSPGERTHHIYGIGQSGVVNSLIERSHSIMRESDTGGRIRPFPIPKENIRRLSDIRTPGHYYLYTSDTKNIDDFPLPDEFKDAGWYFDVTVSNTHGDFRQIMTRNSFGRNMAKFERSISGRGYGVSEWNYIQVTSGKMERLPSFVTKMSDIVIPGMTFYMTTSDSNRIKDFPKSQKGVAGWVIENKQSTDGGTMQFAYRYNFESIGQFMIRNYLSDGTASDWTLFKGEWVE